MVRIVDYFSAFVLLCQEFVVVVYMGMLGFIMG